jgi:hypothetical protein
MRAGMKKANAFLLFYFVYLAAIGQSISSKFELGITAGVFVYQGDLTPSRLGSYKTLKPELNIFVNRILSPLFSLRTNLGFGKLKGDDAKYLTPEYRQQRNFNFISPVFEISELLVADLLKNNMSRQFSGLSPYLFTGFGLSVLNIRRDWSRFNAEYFSSESTTLSGLAADQQQALPKLILALPVGIGIRYPISSKISLNAETSYRVTFTDYLDGFSKAANDKRRDSYQTHSVGVIYQFKKNSSLKCPTF